MHRFFTEMCFSTFIQSIWNDYPANITKKMGANGSTRPTWYCAGASTLSCSCAGLDGTERGTTSRLRRCCCERLVGESVTGEKPLDKSPPVKI